MQEGKEDRKPSICWLYLKAFSSPQKYCSIQVRGIQEKHMLLQNEIVDIIKTPHSTDGMWKKHSFRYTL